MEKKIIIIGAGIAGLAAGCYARMNGYDAEIYELHDKPGGLCTSWKRKGYVVDGCIHWLVGSTPAVSGLHRCWQELGALKGRKFIDHEIFMIVRSKSGREFIVYSDVDRLEKHMLELSPGDAPLIREFTGLIRKLAKVDLPNPRPRETQTLGDKLAGLYRILPLIRPFMKYEKVSIQEFAKRFTDPFLREAFVIPFDLPDFPLLGMAFSCAWFHNRSAGYPVGGSLELARAMERRFLELGGRVHYQSRVEKILVESEKAAGVKLASGEEVRGDLVISAADGHATIFKMLDGKFIDREVRGYYDKQPRFQGLLQASFGVDRDLREEPTLVAYELEQPVALAGELQKYLSLHNYAHDPTMAPPGKTVLVFRFFSDYDFWSKLALDPPAYAAEKEKAANFLMGFLESRYPGISEQIEMVDVATPLTFERYTNNWQGSMEGWLLTTRLSLIHISEPTRPY